MRQALIIGVLLVFGSAVLGATVFREQVAQAAQAILPVRVVNTPDEAVPVRAQGTVDVNVTNGSLDVAASSPVTGGGGEEFTTSGNTKTLSQPAVASALQVLFANGATKVGLTYKGEVVGYFFKNSNGDTMEPPLTRAIEFDAISCAGTVGGVCFVEWTGNTP